ncbi:MAG TPA: carboxymuconolactone decarboxylase family protein [Chloroflexota bacterium]|nr:carboxymuconolactone decarboxylase family protein [Chloroflexota bacterium]
MSSSERLRRITDKAALPASKAHVYDELVRTRGAISQGYSVLLNNPDAAGRIAQLGTYVRFESSLPAEVRELAALTAACELGGTYEQDIHEKAARALGISAEFIAAVSAGAELPAAPRDQLAAVRCARELIRHHSLPDELFAAAQQRLGDAGIIDLAATIGYYAMLSCVHNALNIRPA